MILSISNCKSTYFDITSIGRIINSFSNDLSALDKTINFYICPILNGTFLFIATLATVGEINPISIIFMLLTLPLFVFIYIVLKRITIPVKQLDLRMKTPIYKMLDEVSSGIVQIRIFSSFETYLSKFK